MNDEVDLFGNPIPAEKMYWVDPDRQIGESALRNADHETQVKVLQTWFFARYEDPSENTPYVGSEGGYQYIHGGPFDAREELENEFSGIIGDDQIEEALEEIESVTTEWAPKVWEYDADLFDSITHSTQHYQEFTDTLEGTRLLIDQNVPPFQRQHLLRLLYVNAIIALETYLCDTFIANVCANEARLRKFVETDRHFSKKTMLVGDLFKRSAGIEDEVREYLFDLLWHRVTDASRMFLEVLNVRFPDNITFLNDAIRVRHSIVHHGGKKDGKVREILKEDVVKVSQAVSDVVSFIERQMHPEGVQPPEGADEHSSF